MNFQYEEQTLNIRTKNYQRNCLHDMVNVFFLDLITRKKDPNTAK